MGITGAIEHWADGRLSLRRETVSWRQEESGFVLYDRRTDRLYEGNRVGCDILRQLDEGASAGAISAALQARYAVASDEAARDVAEFLEFLLHEDLVVQC